MLRCYNSNEITKNHVDRLPVTKNHVFLISDFANLTDCHDNVSHFNFKEI